MNIRTWLPIRNSIWFAEDLLVDAVDVDEGAVRGAEVAQDRGLAQDLHDRVLARGLGVVDVDVRPRAADGGARLGDLEDLAGRPALDDGEREALVLRQLQDAPSGAGPARSWWRCRTRAAAQAPRHGALRLHHLRRRLSAEGAGRAGACPAAASWPPTAGFSISIDAPALRAARLGLGPVAQLALVELVLAWQLGQTMIISGSWPLAGPGPGRMDKTDTSLALECCAHAASGARWRVAGGVSWGRTACGAHSGTRSTRRRTATALEPAGELDAGGQEAT